MNPRTRGLVQSVALTTVVLASAARAAAGDWWSCNSRTGLDAPLPTCAEALCDRPASELGVAVVTGATEVPLCRTDPASGRPRFDDGPPLAFDGPGAPVRYACLYEPPDAGPDARRPLVIFLHGGGAGMADDLYNHTSLRSKAPAFDLTGDPARPGFVLVSVQGRNLRYPTAAPRDGHHHDFYFRDLASPSSNPDIAFLDRLIDGLVASGSVDSRRIYLTGWSNGAFFAQLYGIARHERPTPGGNRVASVAVFSGADPFAGIRQDEAPSCELVPYPTSRLPIFLIGRACDLVACDRQQQEAWDLPLPPNPGQIVSEWVEDLATKVVDPNVERVIVDGRGVVTDHCTPPPYCTLSVATLNHLRWPDGVADGSGLDHEVEMLRFLRNHPLPSNARIPAGRSTLPKPRRHAAW